MTGWWKIIEEFKVSILTPAPPPSAR